MQKRIGLLGTLGLAIGLLGGGCCGVSVEDLPAKYSETGKLLGAVTWYQRSAEMRVSYEQAYSLAQLKLERNLALSQSELPKAVILDIDETVLDNSPYEAQAIASGVAFESKSWGEWVAKAQAKALPGALEFVKYARARGVEVFYVSNRQVTQLASTVKNLAGENFPNADSAFVLLKDDTSDKTWRRTRISARYDVILYVGDNLTDFSETLRDRSRNWGFDAVAEKRDSLNQFFVQLPNPMYGDWSKALEGDSTFTAAQMDSLWIGSLRQE